MQQVLETVDLPPIFRSEVRANVVRISYDNRKKLTCEFSKSVLICEQDRKPVPTFIRRFRFRFWARNLIRLSHDK